jgi:hypothetical protein
MKQNFLKVIGNDIVDLALAGKVVETKWILEKFSLSRTITDFKC